MSTDFEEVDFVVFAILVTAAILDIRPNPILQFVDPRVWLCTMLNLRTVGQVVL